MLSNHLILCCPLLLLTSIFPRIKVFSNELTLHIKWPKYWSFKLQALELSVLSSKARTQVDYIYYYIPYRVYSIYYCCSVTQSCPTWQPNGLQHAKPPCPSPTSGVYSNSCPSSRWCHPTISSSVIPFSSHLQSLPASGSFPMSQFFTSGS